MNSAEAISPAFSGVLKKIRILWETSMGPEAGTEMAVQWGSGAAVPGLPGPSKFVWGLNGPFCAAQAARKTAPVAKSANFTDVLRKCIIINSRSFLKRRN